MRREAAWLGRLLERFPTVGLGPVLSVGSGTRAFRARSQPWIEPAVYGPLARRGVEVLHHELAWTEGIDIAGDLGDDAVRAQLRAAGVRTVLCLNVLEHVVDREGLARALLDSVPPGGLLVVTVPRRFPHHADPIDTLFRPDPDELVALFPGTAVVDRGTVTCESLALHWLSKPEKLTAVRKALAGRRGSTAGSSEGAPSATARRGSLGALARMAFVSTEVTFAVLRKADVDPDR